VATRSTPLRSVGACYSHTPSAFRFVLFWQPKRLDCFIFCPLSFCYWHGKFHGNRTDASFSPAERLPRAGHRHSGPPWLFTSGFHLLVCPLLRPWITGTFTGAFTFGRFMESKLRFGTGLLSCIRAVPRLSVVISPDLDPGLDIHSYGKCEL
jgi:4-amino-4-deoxy-L-arabinose transferase-like glycosyltransferase